MAISAGSGKRKIDIERIPNAYREDSIHSSSNCYGNTPRRPLSSRQILSKSINPFSSYIAFKKTEPHLKKKMKKFEKALFFLQSKEEMGRVIKIENAGMTKIKNLLDNYFFCNRTS